MSCRRPTRRVWARPSGAPAPACADRRGREQAIWAARTDGGRPWKVAVGSGPALAPDGLSALMPKDGLLYWIPLTPRQDSGLVPAPALLFRAAGRNGSPRWSPHRARPA